MKDIWDNLEKLKEIEKEITSIDINGNFEGKIEKNIVTKYYGKIINDGYYRVINFNNNPLNFDDIVITIVDCEGINGYYFQAIKYYDNDEDYAIYGDEINETVIIKTLRLLNEGISDDEIKENLNYSYFRSHKQKKRPYTKKYERDYNG